MTSTLLSQIRKYALPGTVITLTLSFYLFCLPTFGYWTINPHFATVASINTSDLVNYSHPSIPVIGKLKSPYLQASSYVIVDSATNTTLASQNPHLRIYPASVTKLATALTALNIYPLDEIVTVTNQYLNGKVMDLAIGEKMTIHSLVSALLIYSANDAAFNLASHASGGVAAFVTEMNRLCTLYHLSDTHFVNFDGIHDINHYSSAADLAQLGRLAIKNSFVRQTVKTPKMTVSNTDGKILHLLSTTNELLGVVPEIEGLKTGWTPEAGGSFVGLVNINGHYLITAVAGSSDRFADTRKLIDWVKSNVTWQDYSP